MKIRLEGKETYDEVNVEDLKDLLSVIKQEREGMQALQ
jgi:hypothetical protein